MTNDVFKAFDALHAMSEKCLKDIDRLCFFVGGPHGGETIAVSWWFFPSLNIPYYTGLQYHAVSTCRYQRKKYCIEDTERGITYEWYEYHSGEEQT